MWSDRVLLTILILAALAECAIAVDAPLDSALTATIAEAVERAPQARPGARLPYRPVVFGSSPRQGLNNPLRGRAHFAADFDGDGDDDLVSAKGSGIQYYRTDEGAPDLIWQVTLPGKFYRGEGFVPCGAVSGGADYDGDGTPDVFVVSESVDDLEWWAFVIDGSSGRVLAEFALPIGFDRDGTGVWEGNVGHLADVDRDGDGVVEQVVLVRIAAKDATARGLVSVEPLTGAVQWEFTVGSSIYLPYSDVADVDGDGTVEFLLGSSGVDNLDGEKINGFSDDHSTVFVVDADGELLWTRDVAGVNSSAHVVAMQALGSSAADVLVAAVDVRADRSELLWLDGGTGEVRKRADLVGRALELSVVRGDRARALLLMDPGGLVGLLEVNGEITVDASLDLQFFGGRITFGDAFVSVPGPEIYGYDKVGNLWVLDQTLNPVAYHDAKPDGVVGVGAPVPMRTATGLPRMLIPNHPHGDLAFELTPPRRVPWIAGIGGLGALVAISLELRRRTRRRGDISPIEARRLLLDALELSGHGAIAGLRTLRRLAWHLQAMARGMGQSETAHREAERLLHDVCQDTLPSLRDRLSWIERAQLDPSLRLRLDVSLRGATRALEPLDKAGFGVEALQPLLTEILDAAHALERDLQTLRRELESMFRADFVETLDRVLDATSPSLEAAQVRVERSGPEGIAIRMDAEELAFVLENLVSNALRAMDGAERRSLTLTWRVDHGLLVLDVDDTGCGIARDDWERVLESRMTSRRGEAGGAGLFRSRRILARYGGRIGVEHSEPAVGTRMRVDLPLSTHGDRT